MNDVNQSDVITYIMFECACGKKFTKQQNLSRHGLGTASKKGPCPAYMERKDKCQPLNVGEKVHEILPKVITPTYQEIMDKVNKIKIEDVRAKIQTNNFKNTEFFYLLIEREFIKTGESIYKIGKTIVVNRRFVRYPKNSEIICVYKVANCEDFETKAKIEFKRQFIQRLDIGQEYFEGNCNTMKDIIYQLEKENRAIS